MEICVLCLLMVFHLQSAQFVFGATAPLPLLISRLIGPGAAARRLSGPSCSSSFFFCHQNGHSAKPGRGEFHCHSTGSLAPEDPKRSDPATVRYPRVIWYQKNPREMEETGRRSESEKLTASVKSACVSFMNQSGSGRRIKWDQSPDQSNCISRSLRSPPPGFTFKIWHLAFIS